MGVTLAIFSMDGKTHDEKDKLNVSARKVEVPFLIALEFWAETLFGPVDLLLFIEDNIKFTSCASAAAMNNNSSLGWWRKSWND